MHWLAPDSAVRRAGDGESHLGLASGLWLGTGRRLGNVRQPAQNVEQESDRVAHNIVLVDALEQKLLEGQLVQLKFQIWIGLYPPRFQTLLREESL